MLSVRILNRSRLRMQRPKSPNGALLVRMYQLPVPPTKGKKEVKDLNSYITATTSGISKGVNGLGAWAKDVALNPSTIPARWSATWISIKHEVHHYWVGSKLLAKEVKVAKDILGRVTQGHGISRRERAQLMRTTVDLFRLIPFVVIMAIPFMELLLPLILKAFPNMLPSTFEDKATREMKIKAELQSRLSVAEFFQETMKMMADKVEKNNKGSTGGASELLEFMAKAQRGEKLPTDQVIHIARLFQDELTLPNLPQAQLAMMCKYMGMPTYGSSGFLRFQLRSKLRTIKEDDQRIKYEGVESLNTSELQEACRVRGMRGVGLTSFHLRHQLQDWLVLSMEKEVPIFMLIMSRSMTLTTQFSNAEDTIVDSLSKLRPEIVNEVALAAAKAAEEDTAEIQQRKIASLEFQQELIANERQPLSASSSGEKKKSILQQKGETLKADDVEVKPELDPEPELHMGFGLQGRSLDLEVAEVAEVLPVPTPPSSRTDPTYGYGGETPGDVDVDTSISDLVKTDLSLRDALAGVAKPVAESAAAVERPVVAPVAKKSAPASPSIFSISAPVRIPVEPAEKSEQPRIMAPVLAVEAAVMEVLGTKDKPVAVDVAPATVEPSVMARTHVAQEVKIPVAADARESNAATVRQFQGLVQGMLLRIQARVDQAEKELAAEKVKPEKADKAAKITGGPTTTSALTTDVVNSKIVSVEHTVNRKKSIEADAAPVPFEAYIPYTSNSSLQLTPQEMEGALVSILSEIEPAPGARVEEEEEEEDLEDIKEELQEMIELITQTPLGSDASPEEIVEAVVTAEGAEGEAVTPDGTTAGSDAASSVYVSPTDASVAGSDELPYLTADYDPSTVEKVIEFHRNLRRRKHGMNIQLEASNEKLQELGHNTGVDFLSLKKKYAETKAKQAPPETVFNISGQGMDTLGNKGVPADPSQAALTAKQTDANAAFSALDDYYICRTCDGRGLVKSTYNHMVLERNCPDCDGDCVMKKSIKLDEIKAQNERIQAETAAIIATSDADATPSDPFVGTPGTLSKPRLGPNLK